jgi:hypothetical protein
MLVIPVRSIEAMSLAAAVEFTMILGAGSIRSIYPGHPEDRHEF